MKTALFIVSILHSLITSAAFTVWRADVRNLALASTLVDPEEVESLTPPQVAVLRKEAMARKARNQLASVTFRGVSEEEEAQAQVLQQLAELLRSEEIVEVRGISLDAKRFVFETAEEIAEVLGELQTTFVLNVKGHTALYYSPNGSFPLRASSKRNNWEKRPRKERDNRGQIIK